MDEPLGTPINADPPPPPPDTSTDQDKAAGTRKGNVKADKED